jgi:hypothetical protein
MPDKKELKVTEEEREEMETLITEKTAILDMQDGLTERMEKTEKKIFEWWTKIKKEYSLDNKKRWIVDPDTRVISEYKDC